MNSNGDRSENFKDGASENSTHRADENSHRNFKISNDGTNESDASENFSSSASENFKLGADENSAQNFGRDGKNSELGLNGNSTSGTDQNSTGYACDTDKNFTPDQNQNSAFEADRNFAPDMHENSSQNFNQGGENSKLCSNENSADGARRDR